MAQAQYRLHRLRSTLQGTADLIGATSPYEWVIACTALLFLIQYALLPRQFFFSPDEGMRIIASRSLRPDSLFTGVVDYPGRWVDIRFQFVPYYQSWFSIGPGPELHLNYSEILFGALITPFERLGGVTLAQALPILCGALCGLCVAGILTRVAGRGIAILGVVVVMLALPSALYSFLVWEHQLVLGLCLLALWCYLAYQDNRRMRVLALSIGSVVLACALRVETIFVVAPAVVLLGRQHMGPWGTRSPVGKAWIVLSVIALIAALGCMYVFLSRYAPGRMPQLSVDWSVQRLQTAWGAFVTFMVGYKASGLTALGLLAVLVIGNLALWLARRRTPVQHVAASTALLAAGLVSLLSILQVAPFGIVNPGLLGTAPLLVLGLVAPLTSGHPQLVFLKRSLWTVIGGYAVGAFVFPTLAMRAADVMRQTGSTWASRYFLLLYPVAALVTLSAVSAWIERPGAAHGKRLLRLAVLISVVAGVLGNISGLFRIASDKAGISALCQPIWDSGVQVVVTDDWWRSSECAADKNQTYLYVVDTTALAGLKQALWQSNTTQFMYASRDIKIPPDAVVYDLAACYDVRLVDQRVTVSNGTITRLVISRKSGLCP